MKKVLVVLLCAGMSLAAVAENGNSDDKPSATIPVLKTRGKIVPRTAAPAPKSEVKTIPAPTPQAKPAQAPVVAPRRAGESQELPVGTAVIMKLETPLSSTYNLAGDRFTGRLSQPVLLEGRTMIPAGAALEGRVVRVREPRRIRGNASMKLRPETIVLPDGERYPLSAIVVDTSARPETDVTDEGEIKGRGFDNGDLRILGAGAGGGALLGAVAAGGGGALIGAAAGTTAGTVRWLAKRRTVALPKGTEIVLELSRPLSLNSSSSGY